MRRSQVYQEEPLQVLMVDKGCMNPTAGRMIDADIVQIGIPSKQIAFLFVEHELLQKYKSQQEAEQ